MRRMLIASFAFLLTVACAPVSAQSWPDWREAQASPQYERGYRQGVRDGERDARKGRGFDYGDDRALGERDHRFRRGYAAGYRTGFDQFRGLSRGSTRPGSSSGRGRNGYQDPAFSRGYSDGYGKGQSDGRDRDRYDPVRHRDYRDADQGFFRDYGSKQAYENNYRAGFRQGYEEGYRDGTRGRR